MEFQILTRIERKIDCLREDLCNMMETKTKTKTTRFTSTRESSKSNNNVVALRLLAIGTPLGAVSEQMRGKALSRTDTAAVRRMISTITNQTETAAIRLGSGGVKYVYRTGPDSEEKFLKTELEGASMCHIYMLLTNVTTTPVKRRRCTRRVSCSEEERRRER